MTIKVTSSRKDLCQMQNNIELCEILSKVVEDNVEVFEGLAHLKDKLNNLRASDSVKVYRTDVKIGNLLNKLEKTLIKESDMQSKSKCQLILKMIEQTIGKRGFEKKIINAKCNPSDYEIVEGVLTAYKGSGGDIKLPEQVQSISEKAFVDSRITCVVVDEKCVTIGEGAFERCVQLQEVLLPKSIVTIENSAFYNCKVLSSVDLSEGLRRIGAYAFAKCPMLKNISIPASISEIGDKAFFFDKNLEKDTVKTIKKINKQAIK